MYIFYGCTNQYEKDAAGKYMISYSEKDNVENKTGLDSSILLLSADNKFTLSFEKSIVNGTWRAGDNGDFTWIKFNNERGVLTEARIGDSVIIFFTPTNFFYPGLTKIIFHKSKR
jgi:hypothetical protein